MAFLFNSLHPPIHVRKHIYFTRFLFYCAIFGNAILFVCLFALLQNQNYFERVKKTPSVTSEIILTSFFLFSKHINVIQRRKK